MRVVRKNSNIGTVPTVYAVFTDYIHMPCNQSTVTTTKESDANITDTTSFTTN